MNIPTDIEAFATRSPWWSTEFPTEVICSPDGVGDLIKKLETGNPAIYTRNYYKNQGKIHFDMRSVDEKDLVLIAERIREVL